MTTFTISGTEYDVDEASEALDARAQDILAARGIRQPTEDDYLVALAQAEGGSDRLSSRTHEIIDGAPVPVDRGLQAVHRAALAQLTARGVRNPTEDEYVAACLECGYDEVAESRS